MEDTPRSHGEENTSNSDDERNEGIQKRRSTQDFLDRWRRLGLKDTDDNLKDVKKEQFDDEDDDDDDDLENENVSSSVKKRFRRLKKSLHPFLPQAKRLEDKSVVPNQEQGTPSGSETVEDILQTVSEEIHVENQEGSIEIPEVESTAYQGELQIGHHIDEDVDMSAEDAPYEIDTELDESEPIIPEVESLEDILSRREPTINVSRNDREATILVDPSVEYARYSQPVVRETHEVVNNTVPTGGLLAVDYLNYRAAKNRDKKNKILNERQHEQIIKDQNKINQRVESRLNMSEKQHNKVDNSRKNSSQSIEQQGTRTGSSHNYNSLHVSEKPKDRRATEHISVQPELTGNNWASKKEQEKTDVKTSRSFENTLHRVQEAEGTKISSEFQFERRHEVKDEPGGGGMNHAQIPQQYDFYPGDRSNLTQTSNAGMIPDNKKSQERDLLKQPVYKQAAITGFWGAVAGIVAFIIMYMLAR